MAIFEPGNFSAGALIGLVLGAFLGHALANRRSDRNRVINNFNASASIFRNSFKNAQRRIESGEFSTVVIRDEFLGHDDAMRNFIHYLKGKTLCRFNEDWAEYKKYHDDMTNRSSASVFYPPEGEDEFERKKRIIATVYIDKLLKYAMPK